MWGLGVVLLAAVGVLGLKAFRTYRYQAAVLHPAPSSAVVPEELKDPRLRDVTLTTPRGLEIRGWYIPPTRGSAIVFLHGSPSTRLDLAREAAALSRHGHGVLLIDMPGHGESQGPPTWGAEHRAALESALDFLSHQPDVDASRIGVFGFSMGCAVAVRVAAGDQRIAALALAGAYTRLEDQLRYEFRSWGPVTYLPAIAANRDAGLPVDELRNEDYVPHLSPRPVLYIAGTADQAVPPSMAERLYALSGEPRELYLVQGAGHGHYADAGGDAYLAKVCAFFDKALAPHA
ncbi:alpha/beta fold hydrolase [Pyxidicoccus parkwayensis]|uniref:Alpha/beta fold hydrolase n=1 Tax=Pyxidicoccus parkwayensis TaxID=2813578 RepID=A0ABX7P754_9BACT|nr:alpha/beta fold hydrolase [Pyxidicoccus parkwaysis]QSQ26298.1 alpha/beta fold hydrolase [Pyxidicoccus parkwaysis]